MTFGNYRILTSIGALAGALLMQTACASEEVANAGVRLIDRTTRALSTSELQSVNGTFTGCTDRDDMVPWSEAIGASVEPLTNPTALSVVINDEDCVLAITELVTTTDGVIAAPIALGVGYQGSATFVTAGAVDFYANASLSAPAGGFTDDFVLTILYSADSELDTATVNSTFDVAESTATASAVPPPDYTFTGAGFVLAVDVDDVVTSITGTAALTAGAVAGQTYVVVEGDVSTYALTDAAYLAGTPVAVTDPIPTTDADFQSLVGDDLTGAATQVRSLIIANTVSGVRSYQIFTITFD